MRPPTGGRFCMNKQILTKHYDAFDRIDIWLGGHPGSDWRVHLPEGAKAILAAADIKYNPSWPYELTLYQPDVETLKAARRLFGATIAINITYVEVARDFPTRWQADAKRLVLHYLRSATQRYGPKKVRKVKNGYYFGKPGRPERLVLYGDRKSKLATPAFGNPCAHTELRFQGVPAVRAAGIFSMDDLVEFDFDACWGRRVRLWAFGSRTDLGAALGAAGEQARVTPKALRARAKRALKSSKYKAGNAFALQMLWRKHPDVTKALKRLTPKEWFRLARSKVHEPPRKWR